MRLIDYESTINGAFLQGKNKGEDTKIICLVDIAHSLSIIAETVSAQYEQSKGLISASQSMLDNAEKELAKLNVD